MKWPNIRRALEGRAVFGKGVSREGGIQGGVDSGCVKDNRDRNLFGSDEKLY